MELVQQALSAKRSGPMFSVSVKFERIVPVLWPHPLPCHLPYLVGIGFAMITVSFTVSVYYNVILAWSLYYLYNSFTSDLPWVGCHHAWNTERCYQLKAGFNISNYGNITKVSASKEFFM